MFLVKRDISRKLRIMVTAMVASALMVGTPLIAQAATPEPPGLPNGSGAGPPVVFEEEPWNRLGAERAGAEAPALEAARQAQQREAQERPAKEAAERAAKEREAREAGERIGRETAEREVRSGASAHSVLCIVPRLKGDSLGAAQSALRKAHCSLGKVSKPRKHRGALVVTTQSVRAGSKLAKQAGVAVKLGSVPKMRRS